jgi:NTE family protein
MTDAPDAQDPARPRASRPRRAQPPAKPAVSTPTRRHINIALQGGGAHGAFTAGVLSRLIDDRRIFIDGISGASAGAMNAVVFTDGFLRGGRKGAIEALTRFWTEVSRRSPLQHRDWRAWFGLPPDWRVDRVPSFVWFDAITRMMSPYQVNPFQINPLLDILEESVDFENVRSDRRIRLFVSASNVRTCKLRIFRTPEITARVLMASACLPTLFPAVEIDGEHFWDGGYLGNPAIWPLIHECDSNDVMIVRINPMQRPDVPTTAREILNRINEMSFNATLVREMRGVATITRLIEQGRLESGDYASVRFHGIDEEDEIHRMGALSKFNTDAAFLGHLHDLGVRAADRWVDAHLEAVGERSTLDLDAEYA